MMKNILTSTVAVLLIVFAGCADNSGAQLYQLMLMEERGRIDQPILLDALHSSHADIRKSAARVCGIVRDKKIVPDLVKLCQDKNADVRSAAIFALGEIKDSTAAPVLLNLLHDRSLTIRVTAIQAIGKVGDRTSSPQIRPLLGDTIPQAAAEAAYTLWRLADTTSIFKLKRLAVDDHPEVAYAATYALFRLAPDSSVNIFTIVLTASTDDFTRAIAARGLGAAKNPQATLDAFSAYFNQSGRAARIELIKALAQNKIGREPLETLSRTESDDGLLYEIITALGAIGDRRSFDVANRFVNHSALEVRQAAIMALPLLNKVDAVKKLDGLAHDSSWQIQATVARALGVCAIPQAEKSLRLILGNSDPRVRSAVLESLASYPIENNIGFLTAAVSEADDPVVRSVAADVLGQSKSDTALTALLQVVASCDSTANIDYVRSLISALGYYVNGDSNGIAAVSAIIPFLKFPHRIIRQDAAQALGKHASKDIDFGEYRTSFDLNDSKYLYELSKGKISAVISTARGDITVQLDPVYAPRTTANFVRLAERNFYDGLTFHRVVQDFVIQGGCPRGDGWGGPEYMIREEINPVRFERGTIGMATSGRDTGGSQFFICTSPQPHLDGRYTTFGKVINGFDIIDKIEIGDPIKTIRITKGELR